MRITYYGKASRPIRVWDVQDYICKQGKIAFVPKGSKKWVHVSGTFVVEHDNLPPEPLENAKYKITLFDAFGDEIGSWRAVEFHDNNLTSDDYITPIRIYFAKRGWANRYHILVNGSYFVEEL